MDLHNPPRQPRILVLEDSQLDAELIREHLETLNPVPEIRYAQNRRTYEEALDEGDYDVILADFSLPDFDGMSALELARDVAPEVPFIFVSGILGEEVAIESFRQGATDYVLKQRLIRLPRPSTARLRKPANAKSVEMPSDRRNCWSANSATA
ncbi:response regulator [Pseudorhizobium sp. NPDC055634]